MKKQSDNQERLTEDRYHYVLDNLGLVRHIVKKFSFHYIEYDDYEDLYQEGCKYATLAAIRFDESKGFKFITFMSSYVEFGIRRYINENAKSLRVPRNIRSLLVQYVKLCDKGFSNKEITEILDISDGDLLEVAAVSYIKSLDFEVDGKDGSATTLGELIPYEEKFYSDDLFLSDISRVIDRLYEKMNPSRKARSIYDEYIWSIMMDDRCNQDYLARKYKVSQSYISRVISKYNKILKEIVNREELF